ncbi:MAG: hypothetical protein FD148_1925 [Methylocystaceae bacterium]|nr:MAG: hypothetical protein FD148_1925 [Methylocystaceae bacterium]
MSDEAFGDQMVAQMPYLRAFAISLPTPFRETPICAPGS